MRTYLLTAFVIILDQFSKIWVKNNLELWNSFDVIGPYLRFTHVKNQGIAFGISVGSFSLIVTLLSIGATIFIAYLHWQEKNNHPLIVNSLSLILGGAVGNMIDRSYIFMPGEYCGVVDFIDIGVGHFRWFTFNIADTAVTMGVILYLFHSLFVKRPELIE